METCEENLMNFFTVETCEVRKMFPVELMKIGGSGGFGNTEFSIETEEEQEATIEDMVLNEELNYESKGRKLIPGELPLPFADLKQGLPEIGIFGMGGLGKTLLAHSEFQAARKRFTLSISAMCIVLANIHVERRSKVLLNKRFSIDTKPVGGLDNLFCQDLVRAGAITVSQLQDPSGASNRNRKKRLKKKGKTKAKREDIDSNLLRSSNCLLYMFASMHSGGYLLYRIDALEHTRKSHENNELLPLLVFGPDILPVGFCTLVHLGHYIYFVGEKPCDVFKIRKDDLKNLTPGEDNLGLEYLIPIKHPMQGPKRNPLVFVSNDNLYVISRDNSCESHEFEKYSPTDDSWTDINPKPKGHGALKSHIVLDNIVYFATTDETVLSCNLADGSWSIVSTAPKYPRTFRDIHPAFDAPVVIVGDMILGAFKLPSDFNITVAASPYSRFDESVKNSFMRPTLAPDSKFWSDFARRFDYIRNNESHGSHYMTALQTLDGQNILCFVSYGSNPSIDEPHKSYALLTFYKILGDHWKTSVGLKEEVLEGGDTFCYYSRQVEAGNAVKSYFKSEFMQRKLFNITTPKLHNTGKLITCLAY